MRIIVTFNVEIVSEFVEFSVVDLLEGEEQGGHYTSLILVLGNGVMLGVVKLEIDDLVGHLGIAGAHVIENIEAFHVLFELFTPSFGWYEMNVLFLLLGSE